MAQGLGSGCSVGANDDGSRKEEEKGRAPHVGRRRRGMGRHRSGEAEGWHLLAGKEEGAGVRGGGGAAAVALEEEGAGARGGRGAMREEE